MLKKFTEFSFKNGKIYQFSLSNLQFSTKLLKKQQKNINEKLEKLAFA
jgi:hypothetical protein